MRNAFVSELVRLSTRRAAWWVLLACLAVTAVVSWGLAVIAINVEAEAGGVGAADAAVLLVSRGSVAAVVAGVLGAAWVGSEFRHGTLATTVLVQPRRRVVVAAKLAALSCWAVLLAVLSASTALLVGRLVLSADVGTRLPVADVALLLGAHAGFVVGCAVLGAGAAFLLRSQVAAVGAMIAYPLVLEPALRGAAGVAGPGGLGEIAAVLPWAAGSAVQEHATGTVSTLLSQGGPAPLLGGAVFLAVVLAAAGAATVLFQRSDLTRPV